MTPRLLGDGRTRSTRCPFAVDVLDLKNAQGCSRHEDVPKALASDVWRMLSRLR